MADTVLSSIISPSKSDKEVKDQEDDNDHTESEHEKEDEEQEETDGAGHCNNCGENIADMEQDELCVKCGECAICCECKMDADEEGEKQTTDVEGEESDTPPTTPNKKESEAAAALSDLKPKVYKKLPRKSPSASSNKKTYNKWITDLIPSKDIQLLKSYVPSEYVVNKKKKDGIPTLDISTHPVIRQLILTWVMALTRTAVEKLYEETPQDDTDAQNDDAELIVTVDHVQKAIVAHDCYVLYKDEQ